MASRKKVTAEEVTPWVTKRKSFTTAQVAKQFKVSEGSARALLAILRLKGVLAKSEAKGTDGSSAWVHA